MKIGKNGVSNSAALHSVVSRIDHLPIRSSLAQACVPSGQSVVLKVVASTCPLCFQLADWLSHFNGGCTTRVKEKALHTKLISDSGPLSTQSKSSKSKSSGNKQMEDNIAQFCGVTGAS
jgi:hypothetical protein